MRHLVHKGMLAAGIGLLLAAGTVSVVAQEGDKLAAIKARQDFMKAQGGDVKAIADYTKGDADQAKATAAADDLVARQPKIDALFVPGTSATDFPGKTYAKPEIWTEKDKFAAAVAKSQEDVSKLVAAGKTGNIDQIKAAIGAVGASCKACHDTYQKE